jgi:protein subunit release factor A
MSLGAIVERRICVCAFTSTTTTLSTSGAGYTTRTSTPSSWTTRRSHGSSRVLLSSSASAMDETFGESKRKFAQAKELYKRNLASTPLNVQDILKDFETEASDPSFWDSDHKERNTYVTSQISYYTRLVNRLKEWKQHDGDCQAALEMMQSSELFTAAERESLLEELQVASQALLQDGEQYELELLLSGPYDKQPCRLILTAGAGGTEANDWVADLKRMYERHAQKLGYSVVVEDEQAGDVVGFKSVELHISGGPHAYGWFKGEKGAHRLVRLSPFNANNKRQTTFGKWRLP